MSWTFSSGLRHLDSIRVTPPPGYPGTHPSIPGPVTGTSNLKPERLGWNRWCPKTFTNLVFILLSKFKCTNHPCAGVQRVPPPQTVSIFIIVIVEIRKPLKLIFHFSLFKRGIGRVRASAIQLVNATDGHGDGARSSPTQNCCSGPPAMFDNSLQFEYYLPNISLRFCTFLFFFKVKSTTKGPLYLIFMAPSTHNYFIFLYFISDHFPLIVVNRSWIDFITIWLCSFRAVRPLDRIHSTTKVGYRLG